MAYERKPNTFAIFPMDEGTKEKRREFFREKGWDEKGAPTYNGYFVLEDGTEMGLEARIIDGQNGKFFAGRAWQKKTSNQEPSRQAPSAREELDDDIPF